MHLHILGICGTFMGGIAALAREAGHRVTGCDANVYPPMSDQLRSLGIELIEGFGADQLALKPDVFVIGNVVTRGNPLMEAILDAGAAYTSGPQWLAENVLFGRHVLAVAGTHGKTTTTSMLAWILEQAGLEPGFLVGGVPLNFGVSARLGGGRFFVIEADEYDTALFDKRSKFVHYRPRTAILNNLEHDHADIFPDLAAIETQFHHLVRTVPASGRLVVNARDEALQRVLQRGFWSEVQRFGPKREEPGALRARGEPHAFDVLRGSLKIGRVEWALLGEHNQLNALAAIAAAEHAGVAPETAAAALASFQNVRRRLELRGEAGGVKVYDDFAHHPTAMRTTIDGLRRKVGAARILAVFEPRSNTMKLGTMKAQLPWALEDADLAFGLQGDWGWSVKEALAPLGAKAATADTVDALVAAIARAAQPGDHVVCMSNGGFGGIHAKLLAALQGKA
ncbi:UDP-N-acetylmuramate:L-alanyl-gamma-D-glutamyl-meso-diaminopimelate ligase [Rubrivivax benzoatilyticus]|uniref:UDP-N-acetylmuramate--L-alanyl-gamma-D-glutamyl-meso-2,6-diaminoheptandioate ligase n=1 Tax=Rubrivivax benzoatilyticus TaxID=316997 RepID=A0ABX0HVL3_9BURK|nr:UDP-N-acetylmuramate:L-alanyl-gamma-D-glutamyl-meso-diaminopimelate ligase [Rubrivivax benzoatilyticus]EGJ11075.1 UDP-N-acetylmuramate [Rubrivivax benzoatilyticus JA2 = ATCC BAA-35]NHK97857.1 UDP-N-acetylmuramate:L-alanyl-gamma-D-glutamyl-meso-diaminopimelate ligase [Rubrivivax benzoatilyticus]NHL23359.1 UDP-N-acetylmuramate:L-alanyl-gamma-D-glutamyl-meso-diaminopimelate ligase [Rubrivivax benzoatilyticus]